ncbi:YecA family protein [Desulfitobacterium sp.]|uniref:YecA family protein n=1 Tax=Desulfitobacterium sp. TaxID=49981 RepID=UPI002B21E3D6|nr:SEC-C metal-binding domain-containing protein [Desulfitobacterium sp.]MEA4902883.1 SEC-C metal-binding domain-containing protein [Desulfitobacterium sp.]
MTKEKAKKIFEQYNRTSDVVRCPNGRAAIRKQLDAYARAAVNLYGIISRDDLVNIFNKQNVERTTNDEIYILLLPLVLKNGWYGFYKEYIVHYLFFDDFDQANYLLEHQADKPRYIPEKNEFLKYTNEDYVDNDHWWNVHRFMLDVFGSCKETSEGYEEVRNYIIYGDGIKELGPILDRHNLIFSGEKQLREFINLIMLAKSNTRIWENNGYTPSELHEILIKHNKNIVKFPILQRPKIGRNDPCPCGSGKKYKKCCALFDIEKTAQLSSEECRLFYETWYGLMGFVNERKSVIKATIKPEYPNTVSDMMIHKVREVLWKKPELIDEYISETKLPQEKIDILKLWRTNHKKGMFFILEYQPEYAVAIALNEQGEDRLYGIKGISSSIANTLLQELPVQIETVLLPFKGKIIYDSFMSSVPIRFAEGAKAAFREMYDKAIKYGIITSLE